MKDKASISFLDDSTESVTELERTIAAKKVFNANRKKLQERRRNQLYKYRPVTRESIEFLLNRELWAAKPVTFNDPFDAQVNYNALVTQTLNHFKRNTENIRKELLAHINSFTSKVGICSLSRTNKNQLMWSHYADEHRGFCIGLDINNLLDDTLLKNKVNYQAKLPIDKLLNTLTIISDSWLYIDNKVNMTLLKDIFENFITEEILVTKHSNWQYENETRIIAPNYGSIPFKCSQVMSITFGLKMPDRDKKIVRQVIKGLHYENVEWYQATKDRNNYSIELKLLNPEAKRRKAKLSFQQQLTKTYVSRKP
ncbi:DUF2971 domain-containing protein [Vibrio splendidus]